MKEKIYIYYTSDLHSHFENWPKVMHFLKQRIRRHKQNGESYFLFDNGDHMDRVSPITEATLGKANVDLLNNASYDIATIGNNEGITLPEESFYHLYDDAKFDVVCANIHPLKRPEPEWLQPFKIVTTNMGTKIGVVGVTAPFRLFYEEIGWEAQLPNKALNDVLPRLEEECDIIILLSHLGLGEDERISQEYDEIDFIIGGHTHHLFKTKHMMNNTLLGAVGKFGHYIGQSYFEWDSKEKKVVRKDNFAIDLQVFHDDFETTELIEQLENDAAYMLNEPIATVERDYEVDWFHESDLMKELVHTLRDWTDADGAMLNAGVLLEGISKGEITRGQLHRICPHPINPCKVELTGEQLLEIIRMVTTDHFINYPLKGFGFRGELIGIMVFSNINVLFQDRFVKEVYICNQPLEKKKKYTVATADTFTFGTIIPAIASSPVKDYYLPEFLRDLLLETVKKLP